MAPPVHFERHRLDQTTLYRLVQQHASSFITHTEASTGAELPRFIKDGFAPSSSTASWSTALLWAIESGLVNP